MSPIADIAVSAFLVIGGVFLFVGSFALAKLPETMQRLHGPTKSTTLGVGSILIASMLFFLLGEGRLSVHELLITLFLFLTAPVSANLVAKAYLGKATAHRSFSGERQTRSVRAIAGSSGRRAAR